MKPVGVDFGSSTIKAAVIPPQQNAPRLIPFSEAGVFYPTAVQFDQNGTIVSEGFSAYKSRHEASNIARAPRDQIDCSFARLVGVDLATVHISSLRHILESIHHGIVNQLGEAKALKLAMTIPDSLDKAVWPIGIALGQCNWQPSFLVREWIAALASVAKLGGKTCACVSLGFGPANFTSCRLENEKWRVVRTCQDVSISGMVFRKCLADALAESVIARRRTDPREHSAAFRELQGAVDDLILNAISAEHAVQSKIMGESVVSDIADLDISSAGLRIRRTLAENISNLLREVPETSEFLIWGELALLLPVEDWLKTIVGPSRKLRVLSLDALAGGAARLCSNFDKSDSQFCEEHGSRLSLADGRYSERFVGGRTQDSVAVLNWIGSSDLEIKLPPKGLLQRLDDKLKVLDQHAIEGQLIIGRSPAAGLSINSKQHPEVSFEHCVVIPQGDAFILKDLDSTNGTFVDNAKISAVTLKHGQQIRLGERGPKFRFEISQD